MTPIRIAYPLKARISLLLYPFCGCGIFIVVGAGFPPFGIAVGGVIAAGLLRLFERRLARVFVEFREDAFAYRGVFAAGTIVVPWSETERVDPIFEFFGMVSPRGPMLQAVLRSGAKMSLVTTRYVTDDEVVAVRELLGRIQTNFGVDADGALRDGPDWPLRFFRRSRKLR